MKNILILVFVLLFSACAKKEGMTTSKIKLFSGGMRALLTSKANNGMILYGKSSDGKSFTKKIDADSVDLVFPNGTWSFYAISWEVLTPTGKAFPDFTGKTYCGKTLGQTLVGTDTSVQINLTNANCADVDFSAYYANQISPAVEVVLPKPNFLNCKDIANVATSGYSLTSCDQNLGAKFNKGYATSYKVVAYEYANFGAAAGSLPPNKIAESACARTDYATLTGMLTSTDAALLNGLHLPTTPGNGLEVSVQVYYSGGPTPGTPAACDPAQGFDEIPLTHNSPRAQIASTGGGSVQSTLNVFVQTSAMDVCKGIRLAPGAFPAGFGTVGSPYGICTKDQFNLISTNFTTYKSSSFDLLADINFAMIPMSPIGDALSTSVASSATNAYSGTFNGQNHKLSNVLINCKLPGLGSVDNNDIGLFRKLSEASVKNLTLNTTVIMCKGGNNIGMLAGSLVNTSTNNVLENLKIHGHAEGTNYIGGAIGYVLKNGASTLNVSYLHVSGDMGGSQWVGGLFGFAQGTTGTFTINRSSFRGALHANSSNNGTPTLSYVGGLIGQASGPALSLSEVVVRDAQIEGSTTVGGFFGSSTSVAVTDGYAEAILQSFGSTNGTTTFADIGGLVGNSTSTTFTNVLAAYGTKEWSGMNMSPPSVDSSIGGIMGRGTATCNGGTIFTGIKHPSNTSACGASTTVVNAHTQTYYSSLSWDFTTPIWTMPDEGNDIPRLAFETAVNPATGIVVENEAPYLKRLCHGNYAATGQPKPSLICTEAQLRASVNSAGSNTMGRNIYYTGTLGAFQPFPAGVYHLNGANFGLFDFSFTLTTLTTGEGIFKDLQVGAAISNLKLSGIKALGSGLASYNGASAGLLAGINNGIISNIKVFSSMIGLSTSSITSGTSYLGGLVGRNTTAGTITLSEVSPTVKIAEPTISGGNLYTGGVAAYNQGSIVGVRNNGQMERNIACPSSALAISLPPGEMDGVLVGVNEGVISEVDASGHMQFQVGGAFNNCTVSYNGIYGSLVAINNTAGKIYDFKVNGNFYSSNGGGTAPAPEITGINWGNISRGFVNIESMDANKIMPQIRPAITNWDAVNNIPSLTIATCTASQAGTSYLATSTFASTFVGAVTTGDIVMCRNGTYSIIPMEAKNHITTNPLPMTDVFYIVRDPVSPPINLDTGRYFNTALTFSSNGIGGLTMTHTSAALLTDAPWNVGTDFFNSIGKTWLLDPMMNKGSGEPPQLVKTEGNIDKLGPAFP